MKTNIILTGLASFAGPGIIGGALVKFLENSTPADVYDMAKKNNGQNIWNNLPPDWQEKLRNINRTAHILEKLDINWAIDELIKGKRADLASLVINSPEVADFVDKVIKDLQAGAAAE